MTVDKSYLDGTVRQLMADDPTQNPGLDQLAYAVYVGAKFCGEPTGDPAQDEINATRLRVAAFVFSGEANFADVMEMLAHLFRQETGTPAQAQPAPGGPQNLFGGTPPPMAGQSASTPGQTTPAPAASTPPPATATSQATPATSRTNNPKPRPQRAPRT